MYAPTSTLAASPEINTTPLIDVLLVMLIIFMIAAPISSQRLILPPQTPGETVRVPPPARLIELRSLQGTSSQLFLEGLPVDPTLLAYQLRRSEAPFSVMMKAEPDVPYADVVRAVATVRQVGIRDLRFQDP